MSGGGRFGGATQRLFYAAWPPATVAGQLARLAGWCQHRCGGVVTPQENLHATVLFLGELTAQETHLALRAGSAVQVPAFNLVLDRVEYWPGHNGHGLLVAVASQGCAPLAELRQQLRRACGVRLRAAPEAGVPHVTLARRVTQLAELPMEPVVWPVREYALVHSTARGGGHATARRYEPLAIWSSEV